MRLGYKESKDYSSTMKEFKKVYPDITFSHSKYRSGQVIGDITLIKECGREEGTKLVIWECKCNKCNKTFTQTTKHWKTMCTDCKKIEVKETQSENI